MEVLEPSDLAAVAVSASDLASFADELLRRCQSSIGYEVAYHAVLGAPLPGHDGPGASFAAASGFSEAALRRMLARGAAYTRDLMPVKRAAFANGGVAIDSEVLRSRERLSYFVEMMAPDGGRHALLAFGLFRGEVVSTTMLGRTGACFSAAHVEAMRRIVPVLGLAAAAHGPARPLLKGRDRELADYVALGFTNAEIGRALGTSPRTVRNQLSALYAKVGASNRAELVAITGRGATATPGAGAGTRRGAAERVHAGMEEPPSGR